ncbi:MAG: hypothetical protein JF615_08980 [Asticcacaulis sp.]|nr:hypothetical protein [Asticcacaulis sp.]
MKYLIVLTAIVLGACQPEMPQGEPAAAPSSEAAASAVLGGIDLSQPLTLTGTEPFWGVKITAGTAVYASPEEAGKPYKISAFAVDGDTAHARGEGLEISLTATKCSDGMSDREYLLTAEVILDGKTLKGCATT